VDARTERPRFVLIPLKIVRDRPLQQQLFDQFRELILSSRLAPGVRLPSSRMLADQFSISRTTVLLTYERLLAEGWLEAMPAKGTFVSRTRNRTANERVSPTRTLEAAAPTQPASSRRIGRPDPSLFPAGRWRSLMRGTLNQLGARLAGEHAEGHPTLRAAIAGWLSTSRGLAVTPEHIVLVNGRQQALHVAGHLLLRPGARAVIEDPCDPQTAAALDSAGAELVHVPVDRDGMCTDLLPEGRVALAHVTPEHQYPLGVAMTLARRLAMLHWADRTGAVIVEEDCEGELRYHGMDVPSLIGLDQSDRVILVGGFCSSLGPWLTLGYMVVPERLIAAALSARRLIDDSPHWLDEVALSEFLLSGGYARHVHRLGRIYASRRDALLMALRRHFGDGTQIWGGGAGLHLSWFPSPGMGPVSALARLACQSGLEAAAAVPAGSRNSGAAQALLLGFGSLSEPQIDQRTARFATAMQSDGVNAALEAD
jgi:GntR family transcriptional regulator/MocR family aminotransferase